MSALTKMAIFDFETTGLKYQENYPTELAIKVIDLITHVETDYDTLIKLPQGVEIPAFITNLTGLTTEEVNAKGKSAFDVQRDILSLLGTEFQDTTLFIAHNANFDLGFLSYHLDIRPQHFMCTRSMAILNDPTRNASLQALYNDLYPNDNEIQEHRAMGDVELTLKVFTKLSVMDRALLDFSVNRLVVMPDRELSYKPYNARLIDFSEKYVSRKAYDEIKHRMDGLDK